MRELELLVRELFVTVQRKRKTKLNAERVDTVLKSGNQVTQCCCGPIDVEDIGSLKLRQRWDSPITVTACPSPKTNTPRFCERCVAARESMMSTDSSPSGPCPTKGSMLPQRQGPVSDPK